MSALIATILFLAAHLAAGWSAVGAPWGFDSLRYLPSGAGFVVLAAALALLTTTVRASRRSPGSDSRVAPAPGTRAWVIAGAATATVFLVASPMMGSSVHLLGDGRMFLTALPAGAAAGQPLIGYEPLSFSIVHAVYGALGAREGAAELAFRVCSQAAGLIFILLAFFTARRLATDRRGQIVIVSALLTAGFVQLFCGYVETYPLIYPPLLLFMLTVLNAVRGRGPLWLPAAVLGAAVPLHFSLLAFAPLLPAVPLLRGDGTRSAARQGLAALAMAGFICAAELSALGVPVTRFLQNARGDNLLAIAGPLSLHQAYHLFSPRHFWDMLNACVLAAPAALMALPLARWRRRPSEPEARLLVLACLLPLGAIFLLNPEVGAFRDWDLLALPALPMTLWAARRIASAEPSSRRSLIAPAVLGAAALHTVAWIAVNARAESAETRYAANLERGSLSTHAKGYGWETLGEHFRVTRPAGREALQAYDRAVQADPHNTRYWNLAASRYAEAGDEATAIRYLQKAIALKPDSNPENCSNLGRIYLERGQCDLAAEQFLRAVAIEPRYIGARLGLARALTCLGRHQEAAQELLTALRQRPGSPELLTALGAAWLRAGNAGEARSVLEQAVGAAPDAIESWTELAGACEALGDEARRQSCLGEIRRLRSRGAPSRP